VCGSPLSLFPLFPSLDPVIDGADDAIGVGLHQAITKTEKPNTQGLQLLLPFEVLRPFEAMGITIDFHGEHWSRCKEIDDELIDRLLAVKINATSLSPL
jgi:hypothetical protein